MPIGAQLLLVGLNLIHLRDISSRRHPFESSVLVLSNCTISQLLLLVLLDWCEFDYFNCRSETGIVRV